MAEYDSSSTRFSADPFQEARKEEQKLRLAIDGCSGSGKTLSSLIAATVLAEDAKKADPDSKGIAVIDTEYGSAALYADQFDFFHKNLEPPFSPARYIALIKAAAEYGYSVVVIDSLSHGWNASGGVLDLVDNAASRSGGNKFAGWKEGTPAQNALIEAMISSPIHVIATMRTAQEWVLEETGKGTKQPRRVGMKPVQRDGMEYEFTIVADMDLEHRLTVSKSRARPIADRVVLKPGPAFFTEVLDWLKDGTPMSTPAQTEQIAELREDLDEDARQAMNAWFKESGYRMASLSAEEADLVIAHLKSLGQPAPKPKSTMRSKTEKQQPDNEVTDSPEDETPVKGKLLTGVDGTIRPTPDLGAFSDAPFEPESSTVGEVI